MKQTTLDTFCKVKISSKWSNAFKKEVLSQSTSQDTQTHVAYQDNLILQSLQKSRRTSVRRLKKKKWAYSQHPNKEKSLLLGQNENVMSTNTSTCLLRLDDEISIIEATPMEKYDSSITSPRLNQQNNKNGESDLFIATSQSTVQIESPKKKSSPSRTPNKNANFSPKTPVMVNSTLSPRKKIYRKLYSNLIETDLLSEAIEHLNLTRLGAIPACNFNLEEIYRTKTFTFVYSKINSLTAMNYDEENVVMPLETQSEHMFTMISTVFSSPINCGYFIDSELDFVFSALTLSKRAQMLFVRMLKRKLTWHRVCLLNYPEVTDDLTPVFNELIAKSFCNSDIECEGMLTMLSLLQTDELTKVCRELKVNSNGTKTKKIENILKSYNNRKPLFPGMKSPMHALTSQVKSKLGLCVCISAKAIKIFDKIITLLIPNRDPEQTMSELFFMLTNVKIGEVVFPKISSQPFPIFADTAELERYAEAKALYSKILNCIKQKEWEEVRSYGRKCYSCAFDIMESGSGRMKDSTLPIHVKRYKPLYIWLKALSKTIDAFKKTPETMLEAVHILKFLITENCFLRHYRARWYSELALIEMHHHKDLEASAATTLYALTEQNLTDVDLTDLLDRAQKLIRRKTGISNDTKTKIHEALNDAILRVPKCNATTVTISGTTFKRHELGLKSSWLIEMPGVESRLGTVEQFAMQHYSDEGFTKGVHCESILPLTLFYTLLWEEIYNVDVPGAWVSNYQSLPCDLTTETFYETRKKQIDLKFMHVNTIDSETLADMLEAKLNDSVKYSHITESNPFNIGTHFKEVINCLGVRSVLGICKKLVTNYCTWKAGFPDLIVWNYSTRKCKIVEVKGPGDKLSTKQKLWLQHLQELGVNAEVCVVQGDARYKPKFNHDTTEDIPDT